jgi:glucokinase
MTSPAGSAPAAAGKDLRRPAAVLGLDIGGTKLAAGVVDETGHVHSFVVAPHAQRGADDGLEQLFALGHDAVAESGMPWSEIQAVGIGCGGPLDAERGVLIAPPHLIGWRDVPVTALAQQAFDKPAALENDATAGAAGEHRFGAGLHRRHMVYLTISTGVGGGVVVRGKLYRGAQGNGGEFGHVTIDCNGRLCRGCGRHGCLEAYVSGTSIAERAAEAGLVGATAEDVAAGARAGEPRAVKVWAETIDALACGLTSIVNLFEPELVVIGGGVSRTGEQLLGPVRERVRAEAMTPAGTVVDVVPAALGDQVGVVGAAAIAIERLLSDATVDA